MKESLMSRFGNARELSKRHANRETWESNMGITPWGIYNSGLAGYNSEFSEVLGCPIPEFLAGRQSKTNAVFVMDAMGTGGYFEEITADGYLAVSLSDSRTQDRVLSDKKNNRKLIAGDIMQGNTSRKIREFLAANGAPGFDLITGRALGGWRSFRLAYDQNHPMEYLILNQLFQLLNPDHGVLVIDPDIQLTCDSAKLWKKIVNESTFAKIYPEDSLGAFKITKNGNEKLPRLLKIPNAQMQTE
ncbi:MAG: hypothetical protein WD992_01620 [Candidatus Levyibacteriota bacterium]